jgi:hypothetical protein
MGRPINNLVMGPAGICNVCGRSCGTLDEAGLQCYHPDCRMGIFIHRQFWVFRRCWECDGVGRLFCDTCNRVGCIAIAKEMDLDLTALWTWMAGLKGR